MSPSEQEPDDRAGRDDPSVDEPAPEDLPTGEASVGDQVDPTVVRTPEADVQAEHRGDPDEDPDAQIPPWVRRAIALFFMWAVGLVVAYWVLNKLHTFILMIVVALFLSLAMEPAVNRLVQRGWRRGAATGVVVGVVLALTIGFLAAIASVAVGQAGDLVGNTSKYVRNIVRFLNDFGLGIDARDVLREIRSKNGAVSQLANDLADSAPSITLAILGGLFQIVTTLIFAFYHTADGPRFRRTICSRLPPKRQQIVLDTWELAIDKTGAYLYSRSIQAVISAFFTWIFLFALGVPYAAALGIFVGVVSQFIPTIGTYIALVLPVLIALMNYPLDAVFVLAFLVGYQQFENYVLGPRIARFTLKLHPALTIGTVIAGAYLLGGVGALLALPATAVIQALLSTYTEEQEVIESELTNEPRRRRRRFRIPRFSLTRRRGRQDDPPES